MLKGDVALKGIKGRRAKDTLAQLRPLLTYLSTGDTLEVESAVGGNPGGGEGGEGKVAQVIGRGDRGGDGDNGLAELWGEGDGGGVRHQRQVSFSDGVLVPPKLTCTFPLREEEGGFCEDASGVMRYDERDGGSVHVCVCVCVKR